MHPAIAANCKGSTIFSDIALMNLVLKMNYASRIEAAVNVHFVDKSTTTSQLQELFHHQQADDTLLKVVHYVQIGWPEMRNEVEEEAHDFWSIRHNLYWRQLERTLSNL